MTSFERDVIDRLGRIETKLDNDFKDINGSGNAPGLLQRVSKLESDSSHSGRTTSLVAWIITAATAIYAAFKN